MISSGLRYQSLVSVIMPSLNQGEFIREAIDSVLGQRFRRVELIVVDGGSSDCTLSVLAELAAQDSRLRWYSAEDHGPADALNKGFLRARGTIFGWLNSDDYFTPGAIERSVQAFASSPDWLMVYGQGSHVDEAGQVLGRYPTSPPSVSLEKFAAGCFICQPTVFFRRSMWTMLGGLDLGLRTAFDFDYWVRAFKSFPNRIGLVGEMQACSRLHDACITLRMRRTVAVEGMKVLARHFGWAPGHWLLTYMEELLRLPPNERGVVDLRAHMKEAMLEVSDYLRPLELETVRRIIDGDPRLNGSPI
ncbi:MAG: Chondroitin polymerase [Candidatus Accumulibacter appositus]|uniref:Chondroitin polymerase n=2 Tax=Candidatus Accumulibacter TaxID=327159 RepID=A0A011PZP5_9PROT|nr:MAG: Chondroitin polymerase [Candidatus Accumulibacter appositus]